MDDFATWFCLNHRQNFTIDPQVNPQDSQYYFGRNDIRERLQRQIRRSFIAPGIPKMMVWGPYGSGKTQTLFYLDYYLKTQPPASAKGVPHSLYLTIEVRSNATAGNFHMQLMEALGKDTVAKWIRKLADENKDFDKSLLQIVDQDPNIFLALKELRMTGEATFTAWRWLTGQVLKNSELNSMGITRNLGEVGSTDLVNSLVSIGNLASSVNEKLIFLVDEVEQLQNVKTGDAVESIHHYLRKLSEPANASVGFLIGFKADVLDDAPEMLRRADIQGRIGASNYIDIPSLPAVADVKAFMRELLNNLTDETSVKAKIKAENLNSEPGIFPFEKTAFELLADYANQDQSRSLPRYIITAINECAIQAWDDQKALIDDNVVNQVAPYVFQ
jgi:hypothetical protein